MAIHEVLPSKIPLLTLYRDHLSAFLLSFIMVAPYVGIAFPVIGFWLGVLSFTSLTCLSHRRLLIGHISAELKRLISSPIFLLAILTLTSFGISAAIGIHPDLSLSKWAVVCCIALGGGIWYYNLRSLTSRFIDLFPVYLFTMATMASASFLIESLVWKMTGVSMHSERFFLTMRKMGAVFSILMPFIMIYVINKDKLFAWVGLVLCVTAIFFCGGRSGIVSFSIMAILFAYFFPWGKVHNWGKSLFKYILSITTAISAGIGGYLFMAGEQVFIQRVASERAATGSGRTDIWLFAWDHFLQSPVFGIGPQMFRYLDFSAAKLSSTSHPHNIILELLLETGIVGTSLLAAFIILVLIKCGFPAHRRIMTDTKNIRVFITATLIAFVAYFINALFLTSFFHGWWLTYPTILTACLGGLFAVYVREEKNQYALVSQQNYPVKVSIVMPCHNGADFLAAAIDSVMGQSETDWELLIINDGSHDQSQTIIDQYVANDPRIKSFIHQTPSGAGAARNTGLHHARGRYIAFLDCDDMWKPEKLSVQISQMNKAGAVLSTTYYDVIDEKDQITGQVTPLDHVFTFGRLLKCNDIGCSAAMIDTSLIKNSCFPDYQRAQDFVFWCNILRQGVLCLCIHQNLGAYRLHTKSRTLNKIQTSMNRLALLQKAVKVPVIVIPYYIGFYILYGVVKQVRSGERFPFYRKPVQQSK